MASKTTVTLTLHIDGIRETLAAFKQLPKEASDELRNRTKELSEALAGAARTAAEGQGRKGKLLAQTVKARRDRVPVVVAGGTKRLGKKRTPAFALLFTSEFGSNRRTGWYGRPRYRRGGHQQFKPHRGQQGYWFFPTVEREEPEIARAWQQAADAIVNRFSEGG